MILAVLPMVMIARGADSTAVSQHLTLKLGGAYVMPTNRMVRGNNAFGCHVTGAWSTDVSYSFSFPASTRNGRYYPDAYQGIGVGVVSFDGSRLMGTPVNIYVLQGSRISTLAKGLSLDYEWHFGCSAGWHLNTAENAFDFTDVDGYGSSVNAYISLGLKLKYALSPRMTLVGGIDVSHYSNGNTDYPNPGINVLRGSLGLQWMLGAPAVSRKADWHDFEPAMSYDITIYGAWRKNMFDASVANGLSEPEVNVIPGHFGVAGFNINPLWHFNPLFSAGASLDFQYEEGANLSAYYEPATSVDNPRFYRQPFSHRVMAGVSVRAELKMPIFAVNIGVGHSAYAPGGNDMRGWYQMFTLKTFVHRHIYVSTGYRLLRFKNPGNLMLGMGVSF